MNYFIKRQEQEYGPYTLADLQRYVGSGNILVTELARMCWPAYRHYARRKSTTLKASFWGQENPS